MKNDMLRQFAVIFTTVFALVMNGAANAIPFNGRTTGGISDSFNVLFVPAGYVFSIWGLIYLLLAAYTVYQALPAQRENSRLRATGWWVALSSVANGAWIYFWHYGFYVITLVVMLVLLAALLVIYLRLNIGKTAFSTVEKLAVSLPFSVYLGWITVATIANITALLSWLGYDGAPLTPLAWTVLLLAAGVAIGAVMAITRSDIGYLLVLVWAFAGIGVKWLTDPVLSVAGFAAAALVVLALIYSRVHPAGRRLAPQA